MTDKPIYLPYPAEMYVKALEKLAEPSAWTIPAHIADKAGELQHQLDIIYDDIHRRRGLMQAADMLRKDAMGLYTTYPEYFPDPRENKEDEDT